MSDRLLSQFLRHLRDTAGLAVLENLVQSMWLNGILQDIPAILASMDNVINLVKMTETADRIPHTFKSQDCSASAVATDLREQINEMQQQMVTL